MSDELLRLADLVAGELHALVANVDDGVLQRMDAAAEALAPADAVVAGTVPDRPAATALERRAVAAFDVVELRHILQRIYTLECRANRVLARYPAPAP
jgi:MoxR-like ATPase